MAFNEVRKDYLLDRWVVIATERRRRPSDFAKQQKRKTKNGVCPFCPGNEHMTPPATLVYLKASERVWKTRDDNNITHKNWILRSIPNLYPAFAPPRERNYGKFIKRSSDLAVAVGHHEVIIESPAHNEHPGNAKISQLVHVINAYADRLRELSAKSYVEYVSIFRNHGLEAGASLSHAHSQIIATPFTPKIVKEELQTSKKIWQNTGRCLFCTIMEKERTRQRHIFENASFIVFAPWASVHPLEFWIVPKHHAATFLGMPQSQVKDFAETLKTCLNGLLRLANDPPYNFGFHIALQKEASDYYHWHLEVYPKLSIWAGFEKSTGMYINTVTPEDAAESLAKIISP